MYPHLQDRPHPSAVHGVAVHGILASRFSIARLSVFRFSVSRFALLCLLLLAIAGPGFSQATTALSAPTNLTATAGDGSVSLSWDAVTGSDNYQLYRSTTSGGPYTYIANLAGSTTTFVDGNSSYPLSNGNYYYIIRAVNSSSTSDYSAEASATLAIAAPSALTATAGDGSVSLSWSGVSGADYYRLYRSSSPGGPYTYLAYLGGTTTTFTDGNSSYPSANGTYYYVVCAGDNGGQSAYSNEASVTLSVAAPTNLTATAGDGSISLFWNGAPGADNYRLYRATTVGGPYTYIAYLGGTTTTFTDGNSSYPLANGTYYYVLRSGNNGGFSNYSNEASATLAVAAPAGLTATAGDGSVSLSWNALAGADYYRLYRASTSGGPYTYIAYLGGSTTTFMDGNSSYPLPNSTYYYVLLAGNNGGQGAYSNEASVTLSIAAPTSLTATPGDGSISLSWTAAAGADYYQLSRSTTAGGPYTYIAYLGGSTTAFMDGNSSYPLPNNTYYYVLKAGNAGGVSNYSNEASTALTIPAPANLTATAGDGTVSLSWDSVTGADYYQVFRASTSGGGYTYIAGLNSSTTAFTDGNSSYPLPNGTYYYVVLAGNSGGKSPYSNEASATLSTAAPAGLTATPGDGSVALTWQAVSGADYYQVLRSTSSGGPYTPIASFGPSTTTFTDSNNGYSLPNGTYHYVVLAGNNGGRSVYSNEATATLSISAPADLVATLVAGGARLTWQSVPGADYYQVLRSASSGGPYTPIAGLGSGTTAFTDNNNGYGLPLGTYYYVVLAGDNGGQSVHSNEASVTVIPIVTGLTFNPNPVLGGNSATGTIYMNGASPADCVINMAGDNAAATLPATVTMPAGQTSVTFPVSTTTVTSITPDDVTAAYAGLTTQATLSIVPLLGSVTLSPNPVPGGNSVNGSVMLNGPAPDGGLAVVLSSDSALVTVPTSVTILAGANSASFVGTTTAVTNSATAMITATSGGAATSQRLQVDPIEPVSLSISPSVVVGGDSATGTVTLNRIAYDGGTVVALACDSSSIAVPPAVTVLAGQVSATFPVATTNVNQSFLGTVSASLSGKVQQASLTVHPLFTLAANAANVNASMSEGTLGSSTSSTLTLTAGAVTSMTLPVSVSLGTLPAGVTGWLSASAATVPAATVANTWNPATAGKTAITLYLIAGLNAVPGSYPITVMAVKDGYSVSAIVTLTVAP